jgi:hypothetical protein
MNQYCKQSTVSADNLQKRVHDKQAPPASHKVYPNQITLMWIGLFSDLQIGAHMFGYADFVVPGATISGLYLPSKVGPMDEK